MKAVNSNWPELLNEEPPPLPLRVSIHMTPIWSQTAENLVPLKIEVDDDIIVQSSRSGLDLSDD